MVLKKKIVVRVIELEFVCQTSAFFLTWYLIDRCQIVTDTYKKMFQRLFGTFLITFIATQMKIFR